MFVAAYGVLPADLALSLSLRVQCIPSTAPPPRVLPARLGPWMEKSGPNDDPPCSQT